MPLGFIGAIARFIIIELEIRAGLLCPSQDIKKRVVGLLSFIAQLIILLSYNKI